MYTLSHIIWFMSCGVHSQSGVTCPLPENKSATRLPVLFHSRPPNLSTDPTCQANTSKLSELVPSVVLPVLVVLVLVAVPPGFRASNLLRLLLANRLLLQGREGFY